MTHVGHVLDGMAPYIESISAHISDPLLVKVVTVITLSMKIN